MTSREGERAFAPAAPSLDEAAREVLWRLAPECAAVLLGGPGAGPEDADSLIHAYFEQPLGERSAVCAAFDRRFYAAGAACDDPFAHFLVHAETDAPDPHPLVSLRHLRLNAEGAPLLERLSDHLADRIAGSPHPLLDPAFVRSQPGAGAMTLPQLLDLFGVQDASLQLAPHPLFDPQHYRRLNGVSGCNELLHYLSGDTGALRTHPLLSPPFVAAALPPSDTRETLLERYLATWPTSPVDPSIFVDVRFANHAINGGAETSVGDEEPLSRAVGLDAPLGQLHPECDPRIVAFVLGGAPAQARHRLETAVTELLALPRRSAGNDLAPLVSVVMPTFHKAAYTALSVLAAARSLARVPHEIIVMENGGDARRHEELRRLFSALPSIRFVKLPFNRFFGEATNLGCDLASGLHILFLNNDCFLSPDYGDVLAELMACDTPPEALGAALMLPDGSLQEFGGLVSDDGQVIQVGKHLSPAMLDAEPELREVDYASAACLCLSRRALERVVGFDPAFEPFYYEDTDLCRRLRVAGVKVQVSPRLRALHLEGASTRDFLGKEMDAKVARNRATFARRWMRGSGRDALVKDVASTSLHAVEDRPLALVATPFDLLAGGGEAYLLNAARVFAETHRVVLATPYWLSRARVEFACHALKVGAFPFRLCTVADLPGLRETPDIAFVMGNEITPFIPAPGRRSLYHLQFPFPWRHLPAFDFTRLANYEGLVVNSRFTAEWTRRRLEEAGLPPPERLTIIRPPVKPVASGGVRRGGPLRIANVGRFFRDGHSKRQDVVLDIIDALRAEGIAATAVLIGAVAPDESAETFFQEVSRRAAAMGGVELVREAGRADVEATLRDADVYLHACGFGVDASLNPEAVEHFGISVVEAVHAGCHPVVVGRGGPKEIVEAQGVGDTFTTVPEAVAALRAFVDRGRGSPPQWRGPRLDLEFEASLRAFAASEATCRPGLVEGVCALRTAT